MIAYLIKSACCSAVFLVVYLLFLEREKMHLFNRWYLLVGIVLSFVIPLFKIPIAQASLPIIDQTVALNWDIPVAGLESNSRVASSTVEGQPLNVSPWLLAYLAVTTVMFLRLVINLRKLFGAVSEGRALHYRGARVILLQRDTSSFSFLNTIFISQSDYDANTETAVLTHELAHVRQHHSLDILLVELVRAVCWFNPLFLVYKNAIQANHEYLADQAVIRDHHDIISYQYLLLDKAGQHNPFRLASNFNFANLKKRLVMITREKKPLQALVKKIGVLPLFAATLVFFGSAAATTFPAAVVQTTTPRDTLPLQPYPLYRSDLELPVLSTEGVPQAEIDEFNSIVARNTTKNKKGIDIVEQVSAGDRNRLEAIYKRMNLRQRQEAKIGFERKMPPFAKAVPTKTQLEKWKNPADYGVWIDEKKVDNAKLNAYNPADFSHYFASKLAYTDKMRKDVMDRFNLKVMYKVQLDLMTNAYYEKYLAASNARPENTMFYRVTRSPGGRPVEWRHQIQD